MNRYFVNREAELSELMRLVSGKLEVLYIYAARGAGVTTLLRRFVHSLKEFSNYIVIYVDSIEGDRVEEALIATPGIEKFLVDLATRSDLAPGPALLYALPVILVRLGLPNVMGKRVVLIIDHLDRGIGPGKTPDYIDSLRSTARKLLSWKALSVTVITAGSQLGLNAILSSRLGGEIGLRRLKGLPLHAYTRLAEKLRLSSADELWRLTAGNPGETVVIATRYRGDISFWKKALAAKLRRVLRALEQKGLIGELERVLRNEEEFSNDLAEALQAYDVVMRADIPALGSGEKGPRWTWSLPVYRDILLGLLWRES